MSETTPEPVRSAAPVPGPAPETEYGTYEEFGVEFFRTAVPPDLRRKCVLGQRLTREELVRWTRILFDKGWATPASSASSSGSS